MPRGGNHQNLRPWQPGASPNPGGRPKGLAALLKRKYGHDAVKLIHELDAIAFDRSVNTKTRVQALCALLDRGWGRPTQTVDLEGGGRVMFLLPADSLPDMGGHSKVH